MVNLRPFEFVLQIREVRMLYDRGVWFVLSEPSDEDIQRALGGDQKARARVKQQRYRIRIRDKEIAAFHAKQISDDGDRDSAAATGCVPPQSFLCVCACVRVIANVCM